MDNKGMGALVFIGIIAVALLIGGLLIWIALNSATPKNFASVLGTILIISLIAGAIIAIAFLLMGRG